MTEPEDFDEFIDEEYDNNPAMSRVVHMILDEMYIKAEPGMDYRQALRDGDRDDGKPRYLLHYLDQETQEEIVEKHTEDLKGWKAEKVKNTIHLGAAPTTIRERVNEEREDAGLEPIGEEE